MMMMIGLTFVSILVESKLILQNNAALHIVLRLPSSSRQYPWLRKLGQEEYS